VTLKINRGKVSTGIALIFSIFILSLTCLNTQAQTNLSFTPADKFSIPAYNGIINFAVNGTYSSATLENNSWTFTNLLLNGSQQLENFAISTQNCNVTIFSYQIFNTSSSNFSTFNYAVEGKGNQILNLGLGPEEGGSITSVEWIILNNHAFLAEGEGWSILHDGTMIVNGLVGNVSIIHFGSSELLSVSNSNLPFYQQHSVAIATAAAVTITLVIAVVIKVKNREQSSESKVG
jgi:hypothetical protein